jgi:hypothetical protein
VPTKYTVADHTNQPITAPIAPPNMLPPRRLPPGAGPARATTTTIIAWLIAVGSASISS